MNKETKIQNLKKAQDLLAQANKLIQDNYISWADGTEANDAWREAENKSYKAWSNIEWAIEALINNY